MEFDYDSLVVLSAVVRSGSFEAAAKTLNVTQSAVSQRIKQMEERFGSILVVRGRPCVPTEDGRLLCQHYEQVELLQHELREQMSAMDRSSVSVAATLRIAVNADSLATWFPKVVRRAADEVNLRLDVIPDDQEFTGERLRSGDALAVVTTYGRPIAGCRNLSLGSMDYLAVASPEYVARHLSEGITMEAVARSPCIAFDRKDTLPEQWMTKAFGSLGKLSPHRIPSYEGHLLCALQGIGWALMPGVTVNPLIAEGKLIELVPAARINIALHWQSRTQSSGILQRLSNIVAEVAAAELNQSNSD